MRVCKLLVVGFWALTALSSCKTTRGTGGYNYNRSHQPSVSDGPNYRDPGEEQRVRNTFGTFMM